MNLTSKIHTNFWSFLNGGYLLKTSFRYYSMALVLHFLYSVQYLWPIANLWCLTFVLHNFNSSVMSFFRMHMRQRDEILNPKREQKLLYINVGYHDTEMHSLLLFIRFALCYVTTIMLIPFLLLSERNKVFMRQSMGNISWCWIPLLSATQLHKTQ